MQFEASIFPRPELQRLKRGHRHNYCSTVPVPSEGPCQKPAFSTLFSGASAATGKGRGAGSTTGAQQTTTYKGGGGTRYPTSPGVRGVGVWDNGEMHLTRPAAGGGEKASWPRAVVERLTYLLHLRCGVCGADRDPCNISVAAGFKGFVLERGGTRV